MRFKSIYTTLGLLFLAYMFMSSSTGRNENLANAPGDSGYCANCHSAATSGGSITLTGAPSSYTAGTSYPLTLTITDADAVVGGFQIVATNGTDNTQVGDFSTPVGTRLVSGTNRLVQSSHQFFAGTTASWTFDWTAPTTGAPSNIQFYFAGNAANDNSGTSGDEAYFSSTAMIPLPVELSQFEVTPMNDSEVKIAWQTRSETNSDYFEIQRSDDENAFESIGMIRAAGNSSSINDYSFMDETPLLNQQSYYRLKQVDLDGAVDYSPIQSIKVSGKDIAFNIFPNPVRQGESINLNISNKNSQKETIQLINMNGQLVWETNVINQENSNQLLNIPALPIGQYLISVQSNNQIRKTEKLIIID